MGGKASKENAPENVVVVPTEDTKKPEMTVLDAEEIDPDAERKYLEAMDPFRHQPIPEIYTQEEKEDRSYSDWKAMIGNIDDEAYVKCYDEQKDRWQANIYSASGVTVGFLVSQLSPKRWPVSVRHLPLLLLGFAGITYDAYSIHRYCRPCIELDEDGNMVGKRITTDYLANDPSRKPGR